MISDSSYIEAIKNCSKWNSRILGGRKCSTFSVFDPQTGVVQRPSDHLYKKPWERLKPNNPLQVYTYAAVPWVKSKEISSDALEMKWFLNSSPALNEAVNSFNGQNQSSGTACPPAGADAQPLPVECTPSVRGGTKFDMEADISEYDLDELDNEHSDEDEWGSKKKRKRGNLSSGPGHSRSTRRTANSGALLGGGTTTQTQSNSDSNQQASGNSERPFACQICGARYKSRPGLAYHRLHVHNIETQQGNNGDAPRSPIISPTVKVSDYCDFCLAGSEGDGAKPPEALISCHDCGRSGHPTCLNFTPNMKVSTQRYGWQCIECKSCTICGTSDNDHQLLFCDDCDKGFHLYCGPDSTPKRPARYRLVLPSLPALFWKQREHGKRENKLSVNNKNKV